MISRPRPFMQLFPLDRLLKKIAPNSYIIVNDVREILDKGFNEEQDMF